MGIPERDRHVHAGRSRRSYAVLPPGGAAIGASTRTAAAGIIHVGKRRPQAAAGELHFRNRGRQPATRVSAGPSRPRQYPPLVLAGLVALAPAVPPELWSGLVI